MLEPKQTTYECMVLLGFIVHAESKYFESCKTIDPGSRWEVRKTVGGSRCNGQISGSFKDETNAECVGLGPSWRSLVGRMSEGRRDRSGFEALHQCKWLGFVGEMETDGEY